MATTKFIYWTWDFQMQEYCGTDNQQYDTFADADNQGQQSGRRYIVEEVEID